VELTLQPVLVASGEEGDGVLVFRDRHLVAILVRLSSLHEEQAGFWFLEKGFGVLDGPQHPIFDDLHAAQVWIKARLADHVGKPPWPNAPV
jgi:hypothetical protein